MNTNLRVRLAVVLAGFLLPLLLSAQSLAQPNETRRCTVKGVVLNSVTGEGINRALVSISGTQNQAMLTDPQGHFEVEMPDGQIAVSANKPGYQSPQFRGRTNPWHPVCSSESLTLRMEPFGVIKGKVTMDDGEPVDRIQVNAGRYLVSEGRRRFQQVSQAQTNEDGEFRLRDLMPGTYYISAGPGLAQMLDSGEAAIPKTYYPGVLEREAAGSVELGAGQQADVRLSLKRVPAYTVRGRIVSDTHSPMVSIELLDNTGNDVGVSVQHRNQGEFTILGIPAGTYMLRSARFDQNTPAFGLIHFAVSHDITGLLLPVKGLQPIPVIFRSNLSKKDQPMFGTIRNMVPDFPSARVVLLPLEGQLGFAAADRTPDKEGWAIRNVMPGKFYVDVTPSNPGQYVESVRCGPANLLSEPLVIGSSGSSEPIEVSLRDDGATLSGTVKGDATNPSILAFAEDRLRPIMGTAFHESNDAPLKISIPTLAPGEYTVYAFDSMENLEFMNPKVMEKYSSKATHVTLTANQKSEIQLTVIEVEK